MDLLLDGNSISHEFQLEDMVTPFMEIKNIVERNGWREGMCFKEMMRGFPVAASAFSCCRNILNSFHSAIQDYDMAKVTRAQLVYTTTEHRQQDGARYTCTHQCYMEDILDVGFSAHRCWQPAHHCHRPSAATAMRYICPRIPINNLSALRDTMQFLSLLLPLEAFGGIWSSKEALETYSNLELLLFLGTPAPE